MIKSILAAGILAVSFSGVAQAETVRCSNHNLNMIHEGAMGMTADDQKEAMKMTMDELTMAMDLKKKGDIEGCRMHAGMAMDHMHGK
jgi:hypothetical protein